MSLNAFLPRKAADSSNMAQFCRTGLAFSKMQGRKSLMLWWCSFWDIVAMLWQPLLTRKVGYSSIMRWCCSETLWIFHNAMPKILDTPLSLTFELTLVTSYPVLPMDPKSWVSSGSGSDLEPGCCNGSPHKTHSSKVNISCSNQVLEFSSYRAIIYTWNMLVDALVHLPCCDLQSDQ